MAGLVAFVARCGAERQCVSHTWPGCAGRADSIRAALSRSTITAACSAGPHDGDPRVASSRARLSPYLPRVRWARGMAAEDAARVYECSACHRQGIGDGRDGVAPHARRALELSKWFLAAYLPTSWPATEQPHAAFRARAVELPRQFGDLQWWWAIGLSPSEALAFAIVSAASIIPASAPFHVVARG